MKLVCVCACGCLQVGTLMRLIEKKPRSYSSLAFLAAVATAPNLAAAAAAAAVGACSDDDEAGA